MKKIIIALLIISFCLLTFSACSADFGSTIDKAMDDLYDGIYDVAEPYLKEDESFGGKPNKPNDSFEDNLEDEGIGDLENEGIGDGESSFEEEDENTHEH